MNDAKDLDWLRIVAKGCNRNETRWNEDGISVKRVSGGANNAMYRVRVDGQVYACKLCVADERQRAWREFAALELAQHAGLDSAPEPITLDESCALFHFPVVIYRWLDGEPLKSPLTQTQMIALLDSVQKFHSIRPDDFPDAQLLDAWFHFFNFDYYINELRQFLSTYSDWLISTDSEGQSLVNRTQRLIDCCAEIVSHSQVNPSRTHIAIRLAHVDPNLANTVWQPGQPLRWIDWEYAGWGDPALELADLRWHISLDGLTEAQHVWLRKNYQRPEDDSEFEERLVVWDYIIITRWCLLIARLWWSAHHGPDRIRLTQFILDPTEARRRFIHMIERAENKIF